MTILPLSLGACARIELDEPTRRVERLRAVGGLQRLSAEWDPVPHAVEYTVYISTEPEFEAAGYHGSPASTRIFIGGIEDDLVRTVWVTALVDGIETEPVGVAVQGIPGAPLLPEVTLQSSAFGTALSGVGSAVAIADIDGDGVNEIAVGCAACSSGRGRVFVVESTLGTFDFDSIEVLGDLDTAWDLGHALATLDADADGDREIIAGAPSVSQSGPGRVAEFAGTPLGPTSDAIIVHAALTTGADLAGLSLATGDFDGDGFDDLAIGVPRGSSVSGFVQILRGSEGGLVDGGTLDGMNDAGLEGLSLFGFSLAAGDFDGDGYDDLLVGAPGTDTDAGSVHVFPGGADGLQTLSASMGGEPGDYLGGHVAISGDEDGHNDVSKAIVRVRDGVPQVLELYSGGHQFEWLGWEFTGSSSALSLFDGLLAVTGGDFDGDGYDDVIVGEPLHDPPSPLVNAAGRVMIFRGGPEMQDSPLLEFVGSDGEQTGRSVAIGDLDGDGMMDVVAGGANSIRIFRGVRHEGPRVDAGAVLHVRHGAYVGTYGAWFEDPLDPDGPHTCTVDWGDGSDLDTFSPCVPTDLSWERDWVERGTFLLRLRVEAPDGRFGEAVTTVHVE